MIRVEELTGKKRVRSNLFGKLILQVQCRWKNHAKGSEFYGPLFWRDAETTDLLNSKVFEGFE